MDVNHNDMKDKALKLLIRSLDNELSLEERGQLDQYLESSKALRKEKALLEEMRAGLTELKVPADDRFADQIIRTLSVQKERSVQKESDGNVNLQAMIMNLFPKVAAACIFAVVVTVLATFFMEGSLSLEAFIGVHDLLPEDAYSLLDY